MPVQAAYMRPPLSLLLRLQWLIKKRKGLIILQQCLLILLAVICSKLQEIEKLQSLWIK